ncbi:MAG: hypothetical protein AAGF12_33140 [Myxococcota bacterium]
MKSMVALLLVLGVAIPVSAQETSSLCDFDGGLAAMEAGRFGDARDHFRRCLDNSPSKSAAYNLAIAYRSTEQPTLAVDVLDQLLAEEFGELSADEQADVEWLHEQMSERISVLALSVEGPEEYRVRVDGRFAEGSREFRLDPGERVIRVEADGFTAAEERVRAEAGGAQALEFSLLPVEGPSLVESPWLWIGVSAAVVTAIAVTVGVLVGGGEDVVTSEDVPGGSVEV